ncbi:MAG TPA: YetF domain-containing protein [Vicinamibacterales bacterium]|nr:YetF domain-containing protein [Vicinamibacterales bacterium]
METVLRALAIYFVLLAVLRVSGKRSMAQITTFDFVLLLIIGEATQQSLVGDDFSITTGLLLIITIVGIDTGLSLLQTRSPRLDRWLDGTPVVILEDGRLLHDRMRKSRVDASDILTAARERHGLERLDEIKYAVLERGGGISIVPRQKREN